MSVYKIIYDARDNFPRQYLRAIYKMEWENWDWPTLIRECGDPRKWADGDSMMRDMPCTAECVAELATMRER